MTQQELVVWAACALLIFWVVGAYNRLVSLRGAIVREFAEIDRQLEARAPALEEQIDRIASSLVSAAPRLDALRAACAQVETARAGARARPVAPTPMTSLRVAEEILAEARARLPAASRAEPGDLESRLAATDAALVFARERFASAVAAYNAALREFPTLLIAKAFGFRAAAAL